jgi:hypothetical protein
MPNFFIRGRRVVLHYLEEGSGPRLTSRVIMANTKLTDIPHINTPIMPSTGPNIRQFTGRTTSP